MASVFPEKNTVGRKRTKSFPCSSFPCIKKICHQQEEEGEEEIEMKGEEVTDWASQEQKHRVFQHFGDEVILVNNKLVEIPCVPTDMVPCASA